MGPKSVNPRLLFKGLHNAVGLTSALFVLALAATGVLLNHPAGLIKGAMEERLCLAADPFRAGRLYRGTRSALERSDDNGKTWEEVPMAFPPLETVDIAFHPGDPRVLYLLQRWQGPLASRDGGTVWEPLDLPFDPQGADVELVGLSVTAGGDLFLETSAGLLKKPAAGGPWEPLDFDLQRKNWMRIVRSLHNGHFFGPWFVKVYDAAAAALLVLIVTGIVLWRIKSS